MAECGICLDALRNPVSVPCGHVHCERCLRGHISAGADALKSTCPTCRKPFHIATPDFLFVPQKYHEFILPCVRKIYMDIPSVTVLTGEVNHLTQRLEPLVKENEQLRQRCIDYKGRLQDMESQRHTLIEREEEAREEANDLRKKYDSLKKKYWETQSRDNSYSSMIPRRKGSQSFDASREILPKEEEHLVDLQDLSPNPPRPKRALPKSRLSGGMRCKDEKGSQLVKRQRTYRHSDVGPSSQVFEVHFKHEDEEDE